MKVESGVVNHLPHLMASWTRSCFGWGEFCWSVVGRDATRYGMTMYDIPANCTFRALKFTP